MGVALLFILIFRSNNSGCGLFQILWIFHPRLSSFDAQYLTPDTHCWCSRYTSSSTPDLTLSSQTFMHPIVYQNRNFQDVYPSSPVAIGLPAFGFYHLATTLAIQWRSWCLITRRGSRLRPTGFSTSLPTVAPKGCKTHVLTSGRSADRLDNLSCVRISEWVYTFQVTYVFKWQRCLFT